MIIYKKKQKTNFKKTKKFCCKISVNKILENKNKIKKLR